MVFHSNFLSFQTALTGRLKHGLTTPPIVIKDGQAVCYGIASRRNKFFGFLYIEKKLGIYSNSSFSNACFNRSEPSSSSLTVRQLNTSSCPPFSL